MNTEKLLQQLKGIAQSTRFTYLQATVNAKISRKKPATK